MKQGSLSDYFEGVGVKVLRSTEIDPTVSNGHEFQGIDDFQTFLGTPSEKTKLRVSYVWLSDDDEPQSQDDTGTWYDGRRQKMGRSPEYRLYYPARVESIIRHAREGDTLFLCKPRSGPLLALMCQAGSSIEQQLLWLFGLQPPEDFQLRQNDLRHTTGRSLDLTARYILELIGVEVVATGDEWLERLLKKFGARFPGTRDFSAFTRNAATGIDPLADPDHALLEWMDLEERLFMTLEKHIVGRRIEQGFMNEGKADVDAFVEFSLSVQNRRKSRAGWALANHIEAILVAQKLRHKREATTEKRNGPDFLFPGEGEYRDTDWPAARLTMLGAKTSCKDRWRQVLSEADRIETKHLLTLEPGISETQTAEMRKERLQLVLPKSLHGTYKAEQRSWLMDLGSFLDMIRDRQLSGRT